MSFLPTNQLVELCNFAYIADREARSDLSGDFIKDENDYTSQFTGALRRIINSNSQYGLSAKSFLLKHNEEREIGGDATIVLSYGGVSKVAIFEAKWPRFASIGYRWDHEQTSSGLSHFSDQLARQRQWSDQFAVFEMFYCEHPFGKQPSFMDAEGSSCVWYDDAEAFKLRRDDPDELWSQTELEELLRKKSLNISEVMGEFGACNKGKPFRMIDAQEFGQELRLPRRLLAITADQRRS